jgi:hypothetical protein
MGFLKRLFGQNKTTPIRNLPEGWTETKISEDSYIVNVPQEEKDKWKLERWKKDKIESLVKKEGFHLKEQGRSGTIYFVEKGKFCEIDLEISGVSQYDILIFFDGLSEWVFPSKKEMTDTEKEEIKEKLVIWLKIKKIKAEL